MSSRKELAGVRIDICSLREALHKIEHYLASEGLHAVETVSMKTVVTAGEDEQVRQCLEDMDLVIPSDKEILMELGVTGAPVCLRDSARGDPGETQCISAV